MKIILFHFLLQSWAASISNMNEDKKKKEIRSNLVWNSLTDFYIPWNIFEHRTRLSFGNEPEFNLINKTGFLICYPEMKSIKSPEFSVLIRAIEIAFSQWYRWRLFVETETSGVWKLFCYLKSYKKYWFSFFISVF